MNGVLRAPAKMGTQPKRNRQVPARTSEEQKRAQCQRGRFVVRAYGIGQPMSIVNRSFSTGQTEMQAKMSKT